LGARTPSPGTNHKNGHCRRSLLSSLNTTRQHLEPEAVGKDQTFAGLERFRNSKKRFGAVLRSKNREQETSGGFYWWDRGGLELGGRSRVGFGKASNVEVVACRRRLLAVANVCLMLMGLVRRFGPVCLCDPANTAGWPNSSPGLGATSCVCFWKCVFFVFFFGEKRKKACLDANLDELPGHFSCL
jgi:hypothetical protein